MIKIEYMLQGKLQTTRVTDKNYYDVVLELLEQGAIVWDTSEEEEVA